MLKIFTGFVLALCTQVVLGYDEKYDKIDVDAILADEKLFDAYIACLLDKGPCSVQYSDEFKTLLPEVVATSCAKCTPIQKKGMKKSVLALQSRKPTEFQEFRAKYDPKKEHEASFTAFIISPD